MLKIIAILAPVISLTACTGGLNSHFGCDKTSEGGCTPISVVNARADAGYYNYDFTSQQESSWKGEDYDYEYAYIPRSGGPLRSAEVIQRLWIAPYTDLSNTYHEPSYMDFILEDPHWVGAPQKEIKKSDGVWG